MTTDIRRMFQIIEKPIVIVSQNILIRNGPFIVNKKGAKIRVIRLRLISPEHDQSRVTQCKVYGGTGEISVCHKRVKIMTIDTTATSVFMGEGILRKRFKSIISETRKIRIAITVVSGML